MQLRLHNITFIKSSQDTPVSLATSVWPIFRFVQVTRNIKKKRAKLSMKTTYYSAIFKGLPLDTNL